jgi:type IV secretory pathway VirB4 component
MAEAASSQQIIAVDTIREGVVVLKNRGLRAIIEAEGINFELKSPEEQQGLISAFQEFLVGLDFSLQLMAYSRRVNIDEYLKRISALEQTEENELVKNYIPDYASFLEELLRQYNIMTKKFYLVIPFYPAVISSSAFKSILPGGVHPSSAKADSEEEFFRGRSQLETRINVIINGLSRMGIQARVLSTEELVDLFYNLYNPMEKEEKRYLQKISE